MRDCGNYGYNGFCYAYWMHKVNWFDGVDMCKIYGWEMVTLESSAEEDLLKTRYSRNLPFWIGYHGHGHEGYKFEWIGGRDRSYKRLDPTSLSQGLSAGLCTVVDNKGWKRKNCSEKSYVICKIPGK